MGILFPPCNYGLRKRFKVVEVLWKHFHTHIKMGDEMITKFALHERKNAKATLILNKSQNLAHNKFGKLHILRYAQSEHFRTLYKQPHALQMFALFAILFQEFKTIMEHGCFKQRGLKFKLQLVKWNNHQQLIIKSFLWHIVKRHDDLQV